MSLRNLSKRFRGIRFRLILIYSLSFGLFISAFSYVLCRQIYTEMELNFDGNLLNHAADLYNNNIRAFKQRPFDVNGPYTIRRKYSGEIVPQELGQGREDIPQGPRGRVFQFERDGEIFRAINFGFDDPSNDEYVQVAVPATKLEKQKWQLILLNLIFLPIIIAVAGIFAYYFAGKALAPLRLIINTVNSLAAKNLSLRLPALNTGDELEKLSTTFNDLLARMQKAFEAQEHFVANASHQLNTPLTIIKGELDVLESKPRKIEDHQKFNKSLREEVERMIELVKNLLLIARIETGQEDSFRMRPVRLDDILISTISRLKIKAKDKSIVVRFNISDNIDTEDLVIQGERQLLSSMFENLLDNSIKYSPERSTVSITINKSEAIEVEISDEGPGIRPAELKNILEKRFRRGEMTLMPGTGIGLSIVYKIAEHHKAFISYKKLQPHGSQFQVHFTK